MLAREHLSTQGTLAREHVSTQGTLACEHVNAQGMLAREHVSAESTLAREHVFSTQGTQFSRLIVRTLKHQILNEIFTSTKTPRTLKYQTSNRFEIKYLPLLG